MTNRELVLDTLKRSGRLIAKDLQNRSTEMTGTEIVAEEDYLPTFEAAIKKMNMKDHPVGFLCKTVAGNDVRLIQPYDSTVYTAQPEELAAQLAFHHLH